LIINSISYECNVIMFFTCIIVVENLGEWFFILHTSCL
jgi:hypothetical protein